MQYHYTKYARTENFGRILAVEINGKPCAICAGLSRRKTRRVRQVVEKLAIAGDNKRICDIANALQRKCGIK